MSKLFCLFTLCTYFSVNLFAQNILPNPGFESYSTCPNSLGDVNGHVNSWTRSNTATPDYSNCGFTGNTAINFGARTGSGAIGMWAGSGYPGCPTSAYVESITATLTTPMVAGQTYDVSMAIRVDGVGSATANPNNCVNVGMYFYNSASPPTANGSCCFSVTPQWQVNASSFLQGTYQVFSGSFTAAGNYNRVLLGGFCNANTGNGACANYSNSRLYLNVDDVLAQPVVVLNSSPLSLNGEAHDNFNALYWEIPEGVELTQLILDRSPDGQEFRLIHESDLLSGDDHFQFLDMEVPMGTMHYRLTGIDANGQVFYSNTVVLNQFSSAEIGANALPFAYDRDLAELRITLPEALEHPELQITDLSGKVLQTVQPGPNPTFQVLVRGYAKGIYILRLTDTTSGQSWVNKWLHL